MATYKVNNKDGTTTTESFKFWKLSHGQSCFSADVHKSYLENNMVVVHPETGKSQGECFTDDEREYDIFYVCYGNKRIEVLGMFTKQKSHEILSGSHKGWHKRLFKTIATAENPEAYEHELNKIWTPRHNSTFVRIPGDAKKEFEEKILEPCFGITLKDVYRERNRIMNEIERVNKIQRLLQVNKNLILTGAPGVGKTYTARQVAAKMIGVEIEKLRQGHEQYEFVQFHPNYDYSDFVEGIKPELTEGGSILLKCRDGIFKKFCKKAKDAPEKKFVFVIDEINRADLSRVFGELFFGLESDYRGDKIETQYSYLLENKEPFVIPPNVYLIGTMNDIDRSVESMDFALRRRFAWKEITATDSEHIIDKAEIADDWKEHAKIHMRNLNNVIACHDSLGVAYQIGGAYFKKLEKYNKMEETSAFDSLWINHIEMLLYEYLRGIPKERKEKLLTKMKTAFDTLS